MNRKAIGAILTSAALILTIPGAATAMDVEQAEPTTLQFFMRRTACTTDQRLSIEQGTETAACASNNSNTPLNEVDRIPTVYAAEDGLPFTLDASRPVNGVVTLTSFQQPAYAGAGQTIVDVALSGTSGGANVDLGSTTVEYVAIPGQPPTSTPWTITLPQTADNKVFTAFSMSLTVRGLHITHGYVRPNATHLTLPTHTVTA